MLPILILALAFVIPALFYRYGKRWLGNQTHPAALFILAWLAVSMLLGGVESFRGSGGVVAFVWVALSFAAMALYDRLRKKSPPPEGGRPPL